MNAGPRPILLAMGGDSGTGKTTLTRGIYDIFGADNILNICLDDYHTLDREGRKRERITALNPAANRIDLMEEQVWTLREGRPIVKPVYNHSSGTFDSPERVEARPIVIIRGLFPLFTPRLCEAFDVAVWLDPDETLKYYWKVKRDVAQRGYILEEVIRQIVERQDDVRAFIQPQQVHADIVVRFYPPPGYLKARVENRPDDSHLNVQLVQRRSGPVFLTDPAADLAGYRAAGGYEAFRTALGRPPAALVAEVEAAGLRGRGGAAFPTGRKWALARDGGRGLGTSSATAARTSRAASRIASSWRRTPTSCSRG